MFGLGHHGHQGQKPPAQAPPAANQPTFRIFCKADEGYCLSIRDGNAVLAPSNPRDEHQHWFKDTRPLQHPDHGPLLAIFNKATGLAVHRYEVLVAAADCEELQLFLTTHSCSLPSTSASTIRFTIPWSRLWRNMNDLYYDDYDDEDDVLKDVGLQRALVVALPSSLRVTGVVKNSVDNGCENSIQGSTTDQAFLSFKVYCLDCKDM